LSPKLLQLFDTGVGDELTVVGQVIRGISGQGPVDEGTEWGAYHPPGSLFSELNIPSIILLYNGPLLLAFAH